MHRKNVGNYAAVATQVDLNRYISRLQEQHGTDQRPSMTPHLDPLPCRIIVSKLGVLVSRPSRISKAAPSTVNLGTAFF